jgi:hypothetical protein
VLCSAGQTTTRYLESLPFSPRAIEVVAPGMNTTVQVPGSGSIAHLASGPCTASCTAHEPMCMCHRRVRERMGSMVSSCRGAAARSSGHDHAEVTH